MSHWNLDDPKDLKGFQLTMHKLVHDRYREIFPEENKTPGPSDIADKLYETYYMYVYPKGYQKKHSEYKTKNIKAIKKNVERDFLKENPWDVSSRYMYAYSQLFKVSMDFLYGKEEYYTDNYDILQICKKTHLSEVAVKKLLSDEEMYICDFAIDEIYNAIQEDNEYEPVIKFWNSLIESNLYVELPQSFYKMACSQFLFNLLKKDEASMRVKKTVLPSKESFVETVDEFYSQGNNVFTNNMTLEEVYDNDKELALEILKDINHKRWYEINEHLSQIENIFWGCSGQFDRFIQNYFHNQAEKYKVKLNNI